MGRGVLFVVVAIAIVSGSTSHAFIDSIPGISQLKSLVQAASGDMEGAKRTQENFVNTAPVVSQVKSAVQAANNDAEGAKKTQEAFAKNLENIVDATPVVGHIKGGIHIAAGDKERGEEIIKSASTTTGAVIGGVLGGPSGAILGAAATDALITGVDSAINKEAKPYGVWDYLSNIHEKDAGEHFDQIAGLGLDIVGGRGLKGSKKGKKDKKDNDNNNNNNEHDNNNNNNEHNNNNNNNDNNNNARNEPHNSGEHQRPEETPDGFGSSRIRGEIDEDFIHDWGPDDMRIDYSLPETMDVARRRANLPDNYRSRLEPIDFRDVNDVDGTLNCYVCTISAMRDMSASQLMNRFNIRPEEVASTAPTAGHIVSLFQRVGYRQAEIVFEGNPLAFHNFVEHHLAPGQETAFALAYMRPNGEGHVVLMRAWKEPNDNRVNYMTTDFQRRVSDPERFSTRLPWDGRTFYIIHPRTITYIAPEQITNLIHEDVIMSEMRSNCMGKRVIGYLASWAKHEMSPEQAARLTNVIYAFVKMDPDGGLTIPTNSQAKQRLLDAFVARKAMEAKGLKLAVSFAVGGWENSQYFSNVAGSSEKRSNFIKNILTLLNDYDFDGVDIDWEYPGTGGATEGTKEDKNNYVTLLRELREKIGEGKLISIAGAAGEEALQGFDIKNIIKYVDWIGVMSYDLNGAWDSKWGAYVGPNSPLYHGAPVGYSGKLNVDWAIKQYVCKSGKPEKIILGIPFYGRYWTKTFDGKDPAQRPVYRKAERVNGKFGGDRSYRVLVNTWLQPGSGFNLNWCDKTKTPWAILPSSNNLVVSYDNPQSIGEKVKYAVEKNLGGVMVWSVDQDDVKLSLTKAVIGICASTGNSVNYKCNPLEEKRWWTWIEDEKKAGMCGKSAPLYKGYYPMCDPDDPGYGCCSKHGYCGSGPEHCECKGCVDYTKNPDLLIKEPVKPSRPIQWHVGFDEVKPGEPRCGSAAPPINDHYAICNPDDDSNHCCSPAGYCGSTPEYCNCKGCKNYKTIPIGESLKKVRKPEDIKWHVGFSVVKPGEPRCGKMAKPVNGKTAICDPDDDGGYCCSEWGYCGVGDAYCKCAKCINSRNN